MMHYKYLLLPVLLLTVSGCTQTDAVVRHRELQAFPPGDVIITGGDLHKAGETDKKVLLSVEPDRLLYTFRENAGLPNSDEVKPYGGWEGPRVALRGHTTGHYLTALSYWYAQAPAPEVKHRIDYIVKTLAECQLKLGNGYLSAFPEADIDTVERTGNGWAPHYTLHKILQGLIDAHRLSDNPQAQEVAVKMGDWLSTRAEKITDMKHWEMVLDKAEQGGIAEALLNLYALTGNKRYMNTATFFEQHAKIKPAAEGRDVLNRNNITGNYRHANATIPQFTGAVRKYELTGDRYYLDAATFFWHQVADHRAFSNGTTGYGEYWMHGPDTLYPDLGIKAGETCCTYNMIKLSNGLFGIQPDSKYADYVERAIYNDILSAIHPMNGGMMYFHTQQPGGFKTFGKNLEVFWCCTGTGMEDHVRYAESVYFHNDDELFVNLYVPSSLNWRDRNVQLEQVTSFPRAQNSSFVLKGTSHFTINFRVPYWAKTGIVVKVNGETIEGTPAAPGYVAIKRKWNTGDRIDVDLPMQLHLQKLPDAPQYASVMYGPLVMAGELGREGMADSLIMTTDYFFGEVPAAYAAKIEVPALTGSMDDLTWIRRDANDPLVFYTDSTTDSRSIKLVPAYRIYDQRFTSYWKFTEQAGD